MKYAGYTRKQLRQIVKESRRTELGVDSILGDESKTADIIEALLDRITDLGLKSKIVEATVTPAKARKKVKAKFPTFD